MLPSAEFTMASGSSAVQRYFDTTAFSARKLEILSCPTRNTNKDQQATNAFRCLGLVRMSLIRKRAMARSMAQFSCRFLGSLAPVDTSIRLAGCERLRTK
jgi:hypothetical protein